MNKLYAAPREGLTGYLWRQVHAALFGPADKYFTPFLSPNATRTFQRKELDEIDPAHNAGLYVVPQLLTNRAEHFLWAAGELYARGYREINFNLGCPAGTVAAKRKGSGLLAYPQELDRCLEEIFAGLPRGMSVSVKTRIGKNDPAEWPGLLEAYRQRLSGDQPVMHRMWELWAYLSAGFTRPEPYLKRMRKAKNLSEYRSAVDALFREQRYTT